MEAPSQALGRQDVATLRAWTASVIVRDPDAETTLGEYQRAARVYTGLHVDRESAVTIVRRPLESCRLVRGEVPGWRGLALEFNAHAQETAQAAWDRILDSEGLAEPELLTNELIKHAKGAGEDKAERLAQMSARWRITRAILDQAEEHLWGFDWRLVPTDHRAVWRRFCDGLTTREIAAALHMTKTKSARVVKKHRRLAGIDRSGRSPQKAHGKQEQGRQDDAR